MHQHTQDDTQLRLLEELRTLLEAATPTCSITTEVPEDPVIGPDGQVYDRPAVTQWLETHPRSPINDHLQMTAASLYPAYAIGQLAAALEQAGTVLTRLIELRTHTMTTTQQPSATSAQTTEADEILIVQLASLREAMQKVRTDQAAVQLHNEILEKSLDNAQRKLRLVNAKTELKNCEREINDLLNGAVEKEILNINAEISIKGDLIKKYEIQMLDYRESSAVFHGFQSHICKLQRELTQLHADRQNLIARVANEAHRDDLLNRSAALQQEIRTLEQQLSTGDYDASFDASCTGEGSAQSTTGEQRPTFFR